MEEVQVIDFLITFDHDTRKQVFGLADGEFPVPCAHSHRGEPRLKAYGERPRSNTAGQPDRLWRSLTCWRATPQSIADAIKVTHSNYFEDFLPQSTPSPTSWPASDSRFPWLRPTRYVPLL